MTIGDIIEKVSLACGGMSKDEKELSKLKEGRLSLQDLREDERKKKAAIARLIKDKQAELVATTLQQNQISLAKEIMKLKGGLDEIQKTEDEISRKIDTLDTLINEKEREINAKKSKEAGVTIDRIDAATAKKEDRAAEDAELGKALDDLNSVGGQAPESQEDINTLLTAALSSETVHVKPAAAEADPSVEERIAAASDSTSSSSSGASTLNGAPGVAVPN